MRRTRKSCGCSHGGRKSRKLNKRKLSKKVRRRQRRSKVKRGGTGGITSYSAYANFSAEGVAPQDTFKSLPAEIPVSTTRKELVGNFPFSWVDKK